MKRLQYIICSALTKHVKLQKDIFMIVKAKIDPAKPIDNKLVALDFTLTHFPFFQRNGGAGIIPIPFVGGYWELHSTDFPDFSDLDIFLGALKLFQDSELKGKAVYKTKYKYIGKEIGNIDNETVAEAYSIKANHSQLCKYSGLKTSGPNYKRIDAALKKLSSLTAYHYTYKCSESGEYLKDARPATSRIVRFLSYHERIGNGNLLTFDANFIHACQQNRILVRYQHIQSFGNRMHKALLVFIDGNEKFLLNGVNESKILRFLGINEPVYPQGKEKSKKSIQQYYLDAKTYKDESKEARRSIKEALLLFVAKGLICDYASPDKTAKGSDRKYYIGKKKMLDRLHKRSVLPELKISVDTPIANELVQVKSIEEIAPILTTVTQIEPADMALIANYAIMDGSMRMPWESDGDIPF